MTNKHVLVTGASVNSLGFETAKTLANWGAIVSTTCLANCETLREKFRRETSDSAREVNVYEMNLADFHSVSNFVDKLKHVSGNRLDVLVNNAGIHKHILKRNVEPTRTPDGYEVHWRTNYLGTFQLSLLLLPLLLNSPKSKGFPRIINVVSHLHDCVSNEVLFTGVVPYSSWKAYGRSKLALLHFTKELSRRFDDDGLFAVALHPGSAATNLILEDSVERPRNRGLSSIFHQLNRLVLLTPTQGAQTTISCASRPELLSGGYYERCQQVKHAETANHNEVSKTLWEHSVAWLKSCSSGCDEDV